MKNRQAEPVSFPNAEGFDAVQAQKIPPGSCDYNTILGCIPYAAALGCQEAEFSYVQEKGYPFDMIENLQALGFEVRIRRKGRENPRIVVRWSP